jgi:hypothetical protein
MDPVTLFAAVTTAFNGVKKAIAMGREVQDVYKQLSKWADAADQLHSYISKNANSKPSIFSSLEFSKSATAEALDISAAKVTLANMEAEIRNMFYYGELQQLGGAGYSQFIQDRKRIREQRIAAIKEHAARRSQFIENCFWSAVLVVVLLVAGYISLAFYAYGANAGKW